MNSPRMLAQVAFLHCIIFASVFLFPFESTHAQENPDNPCVEDQWSDWEVEIPPRFEVKESGQPCEYVVVDESSDRAVEPEITLEGNKVRRGAKCNKVQRDSLNPDFTYEWSVGSASPTSGSGQTATFTPNTPGSLELRFKVTGKTENPSWQDMKELLLNLKALKLDIGNRGSGSPSTYNLYNDRDVPDTVWSDAKSQKLTSSTILYAGKGPNADGVWWKASVLPESETSNLSSYQWKTSGPNNTQNGPTTDSWKIEFLDKEWIDDQKLNLEAKTPCNKTIKAKEYKQIVGIRTEDTLVIGWINGNSVPLSTAGVQTALLTTLPPGGIRASSGDKTKIMAAFLVKMISEGQNLNVPFEVDPSSFIIGRDFKAFSAADKTYTLNWMFKYAANPAPPLSFRDSKGLVSDALINNFANGQKRTRYKLLNRLKVKFARTASKTFKTSPSVLKRLVRVGNTIDPTKLYTISGPIDGTIGWWIALWNGYPSDGIFIGQPGSLNNTLTKTSTEIKLCNEGRPDQPALDAFKNLTRQDQGQIWSSITFYSDISKFSPVNSNSTGKPLTRSPHPRTEFEARINTQAYPTYYIYRDGARVSIQNQALSPKALFPNTDRCQ